MRKEQLEKTKALLPQLTFGLEVEQVGIRHNDYNALDQVNRISAVSGREAWRLVYDGSIQGTGGEFVTGIMPYGKIEDVQRGVREMKILGAKTHHSCGVHVHIDGLRFIRNPSSLVRLIKLVNKYENQLYHALGADTPARRGRWASPIDPAFLAAIEALGKNPTIDEIRRAWYETSGCRCGFGGHRQYCSSRYRAFNLHALWRIGTVEFRWFNSTLHAGKIKAYIQLSALLCTYALTASKASSKKRSFEPARAKYEVRTALLKIGAIGPEFATLRKLMTRHLEGNASWHREA